MDARSKLAITWLAIGLIEIVAAHLFVARKKDPFADPNNRLAAKWLKSVRNTQAMADSAIDAGLIDREWFVGFTVTMMTQMGLGLILLAGLLFTHPWSTTVAVLISVVWIVATVAYMIIVFVLRCIRLSKGS